MTTKQPSAIILAAGLSTRLGRPKLLLELNEGETFIQHIIRQYENLGCKEINVVINQACMEIFEKLNLSSSLGVKVAVNQNPEAGRFGSIRAGIKNLQTPTPLFIHNVDNPFAHRNTLNKLKYGLKGYDYVNPVFKGRGGHPVLIGPSVIRCILQSNRNDLVLSEFLNSFKGKNIEVDDRDILWNINTPEELEKFKEAMVSR